MGPYFDPQRAQTGFLDLFGQRKKFRDFWSFFDKISSSDQVSLKAGLSSWGVKIWTHRSLSFKFHENQKTGFWENGLQKIAIFRLIFLKNEASLGLEKFFPHFGISLRGFVPQN